MHLGHSWIHRSLIHLYPAGVKEKSQHPTSSSGTSTYPPLSGREHKSISSPAGGRAPGFDTLLPPLQQSSTGLSAGKGASGFSVFLRPTGKPSPAHGGDQRRAASPWIYCTG